jgi:hypothetical protein
MCGQVRFDVGVKNSFDVLLVNLKMPALPNISAACVDDHLISVGPTLNFVPFYSPWMSLLLPWPTKWQVFVLFILDDPTMPNSSSKASPFLFMCLKILHAVELVAALSSFLMIS